MHVNCLLTWVVILVRAGEPRKLCRGAAAGADDVDKGAVDVELDISRVLRGHEILDTHQVFARRCSLGDGEVELDSKPNSSVSTIESQRVHYESKERTSDTLGQMDQCWLSKAPA